jgi:hypothetical protein
MNSSNSGSYVSQRSSSNGYGPAAAHVNVAAAPSSHSSSSRPAGQPSHQGLHLGGAAQQRHLQHRNSSSSSSSSHSAASRSRQPSGQLNPQQQAAHPSSYHQEPDELVLLQLQEALLDEHGIELQDLRFGQQKAQVCPHCSGGSSRERSLALKVTEHAVVLWKCHRATCDWTGRFSLPGIRPSSSSNSIKYISSSSGAVGSSHSSSSSSSSSSSVAGGSRQLSAAGAWRQEASAQVRPAATHVAKHFAQGVCSAHSTVHRSAPFAGYLCVMWVVMMLQGHRKEHTTNLSMLASSVFVSL